MTHPINAQRLLDGIRYVKHATDKDARPTRPALATIRVVLSDDPNSIYAEAADGFRWAWHGDRPDEPIAAFFIPNRSAKELSRALADISYLPTTVDILPEEVQLRTTYAEPTIFGEYETRFEYAMPRLVGYPFPDTTNLRPENTDDTHHWRIIAGDLRRALVDSKGQAKHAVRFRASGDTLTVQAWDVDATEDFYQIPVRADLSRTDKLEVVLRHWYLSEILSELPDDWTLDLRVVEQPVEKGTNPTPMLITSEDAPAWGYVIMPMHVPAS